MLRLDWTINEADLCLSIHPSTLTPSFRNLCLKCGCLHDPSKNGKPFPRVESSRGRVIFSCPRFLLTFKSRPLGVKAWRGSAIYFFETPSIDISSHGSKLVVGRCRPIQFNCGKITTERKWNQLITREPARPLFFPFCVCVLWCHFGQPSAFLINGATKFLLSFLLTEKNGGSRWVTAQSTSTPCLLFYCVLVRPHEINLRRKESPAWINQNKLTAELSWETFTRSSPKSQPLCNCKRQQQRIVAVSVSRHNRTDTCENRTHG